MWFAFACYFEVETFNICDTRPLRPAEREGEAGCADSVPTEPSDTRDGRVGVKQSSLSVKEWREWQVCAHHFLLLCSQCLTHLGSLAPEC